MIKEKVQNILNSLNAVKENPAVIENVDYLTFIVSLLPIPGVQQAGQIANKIVTNHDLKHKFQSIKNEIIETNNKISEMQTQIEKIGAIAQTVSNVTKLETKISEYINDITKLLNDKESEFIMDTSNWSVQVVIKQIIDAKFVSVSARDFSQNYLRETQINSKKTHLSAHNNSLNVIDGTEFKGSEGSVRMNGISQVGNVEVTGSSIGFHGNSAIIFGNPNVVSGNCPFCNSLIQIDKTRLIGYSRIQCPNCNQIMQFGFK